MSETKTNLLIVEDDVDLAEMLSAYFSVQGYNVAVSSWGEDAVEIALELSPDIALLDIRLPDIDGYEVCRRLRKERRFEHLPVIFLTEKRERSDKLEGLQLGAVDYITKPFDIQELRLRVRNALRRKRAHAYLNPITKMPESNSVEEKLTQMIKEDKWGLIITGVNGIAHFRNQYGFVATDDVIRAVSLILKNVLTDNGIEEHFIGHIDEINFAIITNLDNYKKVAHDCYARLKPAVQYFYPAIDRQKVAQSDTALQTYVTLLCSEDGPFADLTELRANLSISSNELSD